MSVPGFLCNPNAAPRVVFIVIALALLLAATQTTTHATFDSKGVSVAYASAGGGEAVVLLHGWQSDATMWGRDREGKPKLDASAIPGTRVLAMDCRGHGSSGKPHDEAAYGAEMAEDVVRLLDHLKIEKAHLVGYSMGAFVAGYVVAHHPKRVRSVIYAGQAPLLVGDDNSSTEVAAFAAAVEKGAMSDYLIASTPASRPKPTEAQAKQMAAFIFKGKDLKALAAAGKSFPKLAVRQEGLEKAGVPTLFMYGSLETESLKARVARLRPVLKGSDLKVFEGADHVTSLFRPEFGKSIVEFLLARKGKS